MRISVITITYHDGPLLKRAIDSVYAQQLPPGTELEHIIVCSDEGESDVIAEARSRGSRVLHIEPKGCYNAINRGLELCTGDVVGLLHGTDMFADVDCLARVSEAFSATDAPDFTISDVVFTESGPAAGRYTPYLCSTYHPSMMLKGIAPPHPSLYMRRRVMLENGPYVEDYLIAGDFEYFLRLFERKLRWRHIPGTLVKMEYGGLSTRLFHRIFTNTREKHDALRRHGHNVSLAALYMRVFKRIIKPTRK